MTGTPVSYGPDSRFPYLRIHGTRGPEYSFALDLLMIAKYFERIGDHATNIAEWVIYSVTGTHKEV